MWTMDDKCVVAIVRPPTFVCSSIWMPKDERERPTHIKLNKYSFETKRNTIINVVIHILATMPKEWNKAEQREHTQTDTGKLGRKMCLWCWQRAPTPSITMYTIIYVYLFCTIIYFLVLLLSRCSFVDQYMDGSLWLFYFHLCSRAFRESFDSRENIHVFYSFVLSRLQ